MLTNGEHIIGVEFKELNLLITFNYFYEEETRDTPKDEELIIEKIVLIGSKETIDITSLFEDVKLEKLLMDEILALYE